jgi:uncharacterized glyoxalase superfamily protein PhnB
VYHFDAEVGALLPYSEKRHGDKHHANNRILHLLAHLKNSYANANDINPEFKKVRKCNGKQAD